MNADELRALGLEKTAEYERYVHGMDDCWYNLMEAADAMRDELLARIEELTHTVNLRDQAVETLHSEWTATAEKLRLTEAQFEQRTRMWEAEKQRADEAEARLVAKETDDG